MTLSGRITRPFIWIETLLSRKPAAGPALGSPLKTMTLTYHAPQDVTAWLAQWSAGNQEALGRLMSTVYEDLHRLAERYMRGERVNHTLQTTALVHEACLELMAQDRVRWQNRGHFFSIAARLMRRVLIRHARRRQAAKRGGGVPREHLEDAVAIDDGQARDLIALDQALDALRTLDPRQARIVELRFFAGLSIDETAQTLAVSPSTVKREWRMARAWLEREIRPS